MKRRLINTLALFGLSFTLASCTTTTTDIPQGDENLDPITINPVIEKLRNGFKMTGTFSIDESYFTDNTFQVPDTTLTPTSTEYYFEINFENSDTYEGVDRRYYTVTKDSSGTESRAYYLGENSFNDGGYAKLRYLDYDNSVVTAFAYDQNMALMPYATNGLLNPFNYIQRNDFYQTKDGFVLSNAKTSVLVSALCSQLDGYQQNISFETRLFDFTADNLTTAKFVSRNYDSRLASTIPNETDFMHQTFVRYNYTLDLNFSDLGEGKAQSLITPEPEKPENVPLQTALDNMAAAQNYTFVRQITPYIDEEYVGYDSCLGIYMMGRDNGVYSQAFNLYPDGEYPTEPTASDYILKYRNSSAQRMSVYQINSATGKFVQNAVGYGSINNLFTYEDLLLPLDIVNANIFNMNEDGSYSPTPDNIPYIVREIFMSKVDSFTPVDYGSVNDVKIYVTEDGKSLDKVVATYADHVGYHGTFTVHFSDVGNSKPSFAILYA